MNERETLVIYEKTYQELSNYTRQLLQQLEQLKDDQEKYKLAYNAIITAFTAGTLKALEAMKQQQEGNSKPIEPIKETEKAYYGLFGEFNELIQKQLDALEGEYSEKEIIGALKIAHGNGKNKINYVRGILHNQKERNGLRGKYRKDPEIDWRNQPNGIRRPHENSRYKKESYIDWDKEPDKIIMRYDDEPEIKKCTKYSNVEVTEL